MEYSSRSSADLSSWIVGLWVFQCHGKLDVLNVPESVGSKDESIENPPVFCVSVSLVRNLRKA